MAMYRVISDCKKATIGFSSSVLHRSQLTCDYYPYLPLSNKYIHPQLVDTLVSHILSISRMSQKFIGFWLEYIVIIWLSDYTLTIFLNQPGQSQPSAKLAKFQSKYSKSELLSFRFTSHNSALVGIVSTDQSYEESASNRRQPKLASPRVKSCDN